MLTNNHIDYINTILDSYILSYDAVNNSWDELFYNQSVVGFSLLKGWTDKPYIAVGDRFGRIYILSQERNSDVLVLEPPTDSCNKTVEMVTISKDNRLYLLVQYGNLQAPWSLFVLLEEKVRRRN